MPLWNQPHTWALCANEQSVSYGGNEAVPLSENVQFNIGDVIVRARAIAFLYADLTRFPDMRV